MAYVQCENCGEAEGEMYCVGCYNSAGEEAVQETLVPHAKTLLDAVREVELRVNLSGSEAGRLHDAKKWLEGQLPARPKSGETWESVAAQHAAMGRQQDARLARRAT